MKAKRRHELHENVLGVELAQAVDFLKKRGTLIAWGALIVALVVFVGFYAYKKSREARAEVQFKFDTAMTDLRLKPDERVRILADLSRQDDDEQIAALATAELGAEYARRMAFAGVATNPAEWRRLGDQAAGYYRLVLSNFAEQELAVAKAHLGLGRLAENRGDLEAARAEYQAVLNAIKLAGRPVVQQAATSLVQLRLLAQPAPMATTAPAAASTQPATAPTTIPATQPTPQTD